MFLWRKNAVKHALKKDDRTHTRAVYESKFLRQLQIILCKVKAFDFGNILIEYQYVLVNDKVIDNNEKFLRFQSILKMIWLHKNVKFSFILINKYIF